MISLQQGPSLILRPTWSSQGSILNITLALGAKKGLFLDTPPTMPNSACQQLHAWLLAYSEGHFLPLPPFCSYAHLPRFTQSVLTLLLQIPLGETRSYGDLAHLLKQPGAARAVGNACHANPFPLLIPCHRVLRANKQLGGFAFGSEVKQRLLHFETDARAWTISTLQKQ